MANGKILRQLIRAGSGGDVEEFRRASEAAIRNERNKQHHLLANDLENILYGDTKTAQIKGNLPDAPVDKERGLPLLDIRQSQRPLKEIVLPQASRDAIEELLQEHRRADVLQSYGLRPSNRVIFFGPPGCGKTLAAEVIAYELDLPIAIARLDAMVSSYLGETAANLRSVFEYAESNRVVLLFDEFDAIGKSREDNAEHGELRRVVNATLQMMDAYHGESPIIAATNHEQILDKAIWRRFDESIEFPLPDKELLQKILEIKLRGVRREFDLTDSNVMTAFKNRSGAEVERVVRRAVKRMILKGCEFLAISDLLTAGERENRNS